MKQLLFIPIFLVLVNLGFTQEVKDIPDSIKSKIILEYINGLVPQIDGLETKTAITDGKTITKIANWREFIYIILNDKKLKTINDKN